MANQCFAMQPSGRSNTFLAYQNMFKTQNVTMEFTAKQRPAMQPSGRNTTHFLTR